MTVDARAYYILVSRLRRAGMEFVSAMPDSDCSGCEVVLTTKGEVGSFGCPTLAVEDLDDDPGVFKGQVLSRLSDGNDVLLVGIDPGKRIGLAAFYGKARLMVGTFQSVGAVCSEVARFSAKVPRSSLVVRVGNGDMQMVRKMSWALRQAVPAAVVEVVNEAGTSTRTARMRGVQGDEGAAAEIAFRRGKAVEGHEARIAS